MSYLFPTEEIQSSIVEILAERKEITIAELQRSLKEDHKITVSLPNLYKIINKMISAYMLAKNKDKLILNLVWLTQVGRFLSIAKQSTQQAFSSIPFPLKDGERVTFQADSLNSLDPIWNHALVELQNFTNTTPIYVYASHPWYPLGTLEAETQLYQSLTNENHEIKMIYGNDSFLDKYGNKLIKLPHFQSKIDPTVPLLKEGYIVWLFGEYILEAIYPEIISKYFSSFFKTITQIEDFDTEMFTTIFKMKAACKINVERSKTKAKKLKAILEKHIP